MPRPIQLLALSLVTASLTSCFAVTDLDRFQKNNGRYADLSLTVRGMKSHVNEYFEYRVVDSENIVQSRGIALPLGGVDASFFAPRAVPTDKPVRVDFWADHDNSHSYDSTATEAVDHAWRIPVDLAAVGKDGVVISFDHNTSFTYLNDPAGPPREVGKAAKVTLHNMMMRADGRIEVRVADTFTSRVVSLFRYPKIDKNDVVTEVPGMIEAGNTYTIDITIDKESAGASSLEGYRLQQDGTADGLAVDFDLANAAALRIGDPARP